MTESERLDAVAAWYFDRCSETWWPLWRAIWTMIGIHAAIVSVKMLDPIPSVLAE